MSNKRKREEELAKKPKSAPSRNATTAGKQLRVEDALAYLDKVKTTFNSLPPVYDQFLSIMKDFKAQNINTPGVIQRVTALFEGHYELILGFNTFLPPGYKIELCDIDGGEEVSPEPSQEDPPQPTPAQEKEIHIPQEPDDEDVDRAIIFWHKFKSKLAERPELGECLASYQAESITLATLVVKLGAVLHKDEALWEEFKTFLPAWAKNIPVVVPSKPEPARAPPPKASGRGGRRGASAPGAHVAVRGRRWDAGWKRPRAEEDGATPPAQAAVAPEKQEPPPKIEPVHPVKKKRISDFGPSYRLAHHCKSAGRCSGRDELCSSVLNDDLVSMPVGSEEATNFQKTQADEILFQCEDDRCELDWFIDTNESTLLILERAWDRLSKCSTSEEQRKIPIELKVCHQMAIARLYAEKSAEIFEGLKRNPLVTLSLVLLRLRKKQVELRQTRDQLGRFWKDVYDSSAQKFWEIHTAAFRVSEKRLLSAKGLANEAEQATGCTFLGSSFTMGPVSVHADAFSLVCWTVSRGNRGIALQSLQELWDTLVFPLFSIEPLHSHSPPHPPRCRPTSGGFQPLSEAVPSGQPSSPPPPPSTRLYANQDVFVLVRLYQILHERLSKARELAAQMEGKAEQATVRELPPPDPPSFREVPVAVAGRTEAESGLAAGMVPEASDAPPPPPPPPPPSAPSAPGLYAQFLALLREYLAGAKPDRYELGVRQLLGFGAYFLVTLDKVILSLIGQAATCSSESSRRVLRLFTYDAQRRFSTPDDFMDRQAYEAAKESLVFKIVHTGLAGPTGAFGATGTLFVRAERPAPGRADPAELQCVAAQILTPCPDACGPHVLLRRNVRQCMGHFGRFRAAKGRLLPDRQALHGHALWPNEGGRLLPGRPGGPGDVFVTADAFRTRRKANRANKAWSLLH